MSKEINAEEVAKGIEQLREEYRKVASERDELKQKLEEAQNALVATARKTAAKRDEVVRKIASLSGNLVGNGLLDEDKENEFRTMVEEDPTELVGTCLKLASMVRAPSAAQVDTDPGIEDGESAKASDPIEEFVS